VLSARQCHNGASTFEIDLGRENQPDSRRMQTMSQEEQIKTAFERKAKVLAARESLGQGTATTVARSTNGLTCEIEEGDWKLMCDVPEPSGGNNAAPNPGLYARGALAACIVMSYTTWAVLRGIPIKNVEVEIQADYDARGHYAVSDVTSGYLEIRYNVTIESDAPEADILEMMDKADQHTAVLDVFANKQPVRREVKIVAPSS